ncbi:MAG: pitrilysin family protein [Polyangiales bacterium]
MKLVLASLIGLVVCGACSGHQPAPPPTAATPPSAPPGPPPDAFREQAPTADAPLVLVAPRVAEHRLENGLRVLLVERHELPLVAVQLVITQGAGDVPAARPGLLSFLGDTLEQGTTRRTALEVNDAYDAIGAEHEAWFDWDAGGVRVKVLSSQLEAALEIMSDVALHASFPEAEVARVRSRRVASLQADKSKPVVAARNAAAAAVFGRQHVYGHNLEGEVSDNQKIKRADLVKAYASLFSPRQAALVVVGDVTADLVLPKLAAAFGSWQAPRTAAARQPPPSTMRAANAPRIVFVDKPGTQSQVQLARQGVPRSTADRDRLQVMNTIFGGMFSSRINLNLREKHAYTYGARSELTLRHGAGPFVVAASIAADKTVPAIREVFTELEALRREGPSPAELALAKESMRLAMPARFQTVSDVATAVAELAIYDLPLDEYQTRPQRLDAVTAADVQRVAADLLASDAMTVIVVGDKTKLAQDLGALQLGALEERDVFGNPVAGG